MTDNEYQEHKIINVGKPFADGARSVTLDDGFGIVVPGDSPVIPVPGMTLRLYGKGLGSPVRGMILDDQTVYYRTADEDAEYRANEMYGVDARDWLSRWDDGRAVWSIEMGGIGPGYEQCIHITVAELVRHILANEYDTEAWQSDEKIFSEDIEAIRTASFKNEVIKGLGLSGAQFGAALSLATTIVIHGPRYLMEKESLKDRHIQVSKNWPRAA